MSTAKGQLLKGIWLGQAQRALTTIPSTRTPSENRTITFHVEDARKCHWDTSPLAIFTVFTFVIFVQLGILSSSFYHWEERRAKRN